MYGTNAIAGKTETGLITVGNPWYTIQGEGPWMGCTAIFVRLAYCNLRCFWCDTEFERNTIMWGSAGLLATKLVSMSEKHNCPRVVITGGEPLLQEQVPELIELLHTKEIKCQIETAGTVWPKNMDYVAQRAIIVVSPKTPKVHPRIAREAAAWKYIIRDGELSEDDGLPNMSTQDKLSVARVKLARPPNFARNSIYVQPCDEGVLDPFLTQKNLKRTVEVAMNFGYRLSLQMHKIIGVD